MPVCLTHNQQYQLGDWCAYCGQPATNIGGAVVAAVEATDGLEFRGPQLVVCPRCTVPVPAEAVHRCNCEPVILPEIREEDIPPHERL